MAAVSLFMQRPGRVPANAWIASLVSAAGGESRMLEPRLTGFPWAPYDRSSGRTLRLRGAIGETLATVRGHATSSARHAAGIAQLLDGSERRALATLTAAAEGAHDPDVWSDLSAVLHHVGLQNGAPELLAEALGACDRALALDPEHAAALFNRALTIERLGLKDDARDAWTRFLARDATSDWSAEARAHLAAVAPPPPFVMPDDRASAERLVARDPFAARASGLKDALGEWGESLLAGRDAEPHLAVARHLGAALAGARGDATLQRSVAAIDASAGETRLRLAAAHADYRRGLQRFQGNQPVDAEPLFRRAADEFERAGSPMSIPARYFAAAVTYEQGRQSEAEAELEGLFATIGPELPAYRAMVLWQLGTCRAARGDWGVAIRRYEESVTLFDALRETSNAAAVRRLLAFVFDRTGDPRTAWLHYVAALRGLGDRSSAVLEKTVSTIADAAVLRRDWRTAASFLTIDVGIARRLGNDVQAAHSLLMRAIVHDRLGDREAAHADLADARAAAARVHDPAYAAFLRVAELRAQAMLSDTPPRDAEALLTEAIRFHGTIERLDLPGLFLERARARHRAGDRVAALSDVEAGIAELERQRSSLPEGEARWGAFHAAEELFDEGIELALAQRDAESALAFAERARARSLLDAYGVTERAGVERVPANAIVVEYRVLQSRTIIFVARRSGVRAIAVPISRDALVREIEALHAAIIGGRPAGTVVYERLIAPVESELAGVETVIFAPDAVTAAIPFNALAGRARRHLVADRRIVVAPSLAAYAALAERSIPTVASPQLLLIPAPAAVADAGSLAFVRSEAQQVAESYASVRSLAESEAQMTDLMRDAPAANVIHFAGHAIGDESGFVPASIVLREDGAERRVTAAEIAKLRLRRTSVVVLAGCSTARGTRRAAEGVISVAQGFLAAGAPSVIATLWPIDDRDASIFFPRLHRYLAEGRAPADALRAAQLESLQRGDVPMSMWAAVQNFGS